VSRLDDRILIRVTVDGPAVATLVPGSRTVVPARRPASWEPGVMAPSTAEAAAAPAGAADPEIIDVLQPDPATMDLADATRVVAGGAGLASPASDARARATFALLARVAAAMGASVGATRVATDAGWIGYERQIGTTGVAVDPDLYIAFGVSGATQHVGGLGTPRHVVSVNTDPSSPMTAMADLGLVTDGPALLAELARRFGIAVPAGAIPDPEEVRT
jgi:electron transfer flavoprotein alpha subunit